MSTVKRHRNYIKHLDVRVVIEWGVSPAQTREIVYTLTGAYEYCYEYCIDDLVSLSLFVHSTNVPLPSIRHFKVLAVQIHNIWSLSRKAKS